MIHISYFKNQLTWNHRDHNEAISNATSPFEETFIEKMPGSKLVIGCIKYRSCNVTNLRGCNIDQSYKYAECYHRAREKNLTYLEETKRECVAVAITSDLLIYRWVRITCSQRLHASYICSETGNWPSIQNSVSHASWPRTRGFRQ